MLKNTPLVALGLVLLIAAALLADSKSPPAQALSPREAHLKAWETGKFWPAGYQQSQAVTSSKAIYTVTTTADPAPGSLRDAINLANANPGRDTIRFNIPGAGPHTIFPASPLPWLMDTAGVLIDGLSQPGTVGGWPPMGWMLMIEIDGINAGPTDGIVAQSSHNTIRGLVVTHFEQHGLSIQGGPINLDVFDNNFYWNLVGLAPDGITPKGNGWNMAGLWAGICIRNAPPDSITPAFAHDNTIEANVCSYNYSEGIHVMGPIQPGDVHSNLVLDNFAGLDISGTVDRGNAHTGIGLYEGAHDNVVGGNHSSGNGYSGIDLNGYNNVPFPPAPPIQTHSNTVQDNVVGLDYNGNPMKNDYYGIAVGVYGPSFWGCADNNQIGPTNVVSQNDSDGVYVWEDPVNSTNADGNWITQNSIWDNGGLGIDLQVDGVTPNDPGDPDKLANQEMNFPVITSVVLAAGVTTISGTLDTPNPDQATIEVFQARLDPTGYGEGRRYLGSAAPDPLGNWSLVDNTLVAGDSVTATATDQFNNTSEFCATAGVPGQPQADTCEYYKNGYVDFCPNSMPDFDQKQDAWTSPITGNWSWCGPVALGNCIWWFDSKFEPNPVDPRPFWPGPGNPPPNDGYPLISSYEPVGGLWDDHDTNNVMPFVQLLMPMCNTDGPGPGTVLWDLDAGFHAWLASVGLTGAYTSYVVLGPEFEEIRDSILSCQDVILLLGFYELLPTDPWCQWVGGHYVTAAGVCFTETDICVSDPMFDANEGEPPAGSAHGSSDHNDASLVSGLHGTRHHDRYNLAPNTTGCPSPATWMFTDYPNQWTDIGVFENQNPIDPTPMVTYGGGPIVVLLDAAIIICPVDTTPEPTHGKVKHNLDGYLPDFGSPIGTEWHELWPNFCQNWTCSSWIDNGDGILSHCDTIDFVTSTIPTVKIWEHVEVVTPTITISNPQDPTDTAYLDLISPPNPLIDPMTSPVGSYWHEVFPNYCIVWQIVSWTDNGNGYLDECDYIDIEAGGVITTWHVEGYETDIITTPLVPPDADEFDHNIDGFKPDLADPVGTQWHELWPTYCQIWQLMEWRDNGDGIFGYCDTIAFEDPTAPDTTIWKHILEVTGTMVAVGPAGDTIYFDYMCGNPLADPITLPIGTFWHEVYPVFCQRWILRHWADNGSSILDSCDYVDLELIDGPDSGLIISVHVVGWHTDIISEYIPPPTEPPEPVPGKVKHNLDGYLPTDGSPLGTYWHELWPLFCDTFVCSSWVDNGDGILSACDTVDFVVPAWGGWKTWQHVEVVTPTLTVTTLTTPSVTMYLDGLDPNPLILPINNPIGSWWHEVYPTYCVVWRVTGWVDNGNGFVDFCDNLTLSDGIGSITVHVEAVETDIITSPLPNPDADQYDHNVTGYRPVDGDPSGTLWHELWPNYCQMWIVDSWHDNGDDILSFCDTLRFRNIDLPDSFLVKHVLEVTGTMKAFDGTDTIYYDYMCGNPMAAVISNPVGLFWHEIWPNFCLRWLCVRWTDNGSGFLDSCDFVDLELLDGIDSGLIKTVHVEGWATDIITEIIGEPGPPDDTCEYYKLPYQDYSPYGVPDFDQKQDGWIGLPYGGWSYCGPVALADCFWWMDSRFELSTSPPPPAVSDNYPLVQNYNPVGLFDDHLPSNVIPFVDSLAAYSNCSPLTQGTWVQDLITGAANWISSRGLDTVHNHLKVNAVPGPDFTFIRDELLRCEDVILLLGFYEDHGGPVGYCRLGGHYVTVAGVCTTETRICVSDPWYDENEGEPPVGGSGHGPAVHNDAQFISGPHGTIHHDGYQAVVNPIPAPNPVILELRDYHDNWTTTEIFNFREMNQTDPPIPYCPWQQGPIVTMIDWAITVSPCCNTDGMRGNADGLISAGGEVDVADLTYLVAYLFQGGPAPLCLEEGNVDGIVGVGGPVDVADLTYLVAYLFLGGPAPAPCP